MKINMIWVEILTLTSSSWTQLEDESLAVFHFRRHLLNIINKYCELTLEFAVFFRDTFGTVKYFQVVDKRSFSS